MGGKKADSMAKQKTMPANALLQAMFQFDLYKPTQGRTIRKIVGGVIFFGAALASWQIYNSLSIDFGWLSPIQAVYPQYTIPLALTLLGLWLGFRIVNIPTFADFLISVEAEMDKVTWPSTGQVYNASMVVIVAIFTLMFSLFFFDMVWQWLFRLIGVQQF